jgi:hypothetical protein
MLKCKCAVGSLGVAVESLPFLNKTVDERDWHYLPDSLGGGVQAYIAGFHHLHCLVCVLYPRFYSLMENSTPWLTERLESHTTVHLST